MRRIRTPKLPTMETRKTRTDGLALLGLAALVSQEIAPMVEGL